MAEPSGGKTPLVKIYGRLGSAEAYQLRDFLHRCDVPFEWIPLESDAQARLPVCEFPDGTRMESPTIRQVTEKLGWFANPSRAEYDLAIYGAGPAGLSAAVYGSSDGLKTVLVERWAIGGQAASSPRIENYLGFPEGTSGAELAERAREQAYKFGTEILLARKGVRAEMTAGKGVGYLEDGTRIVARASICATGIEYRRLGLPEAERFLGAGVYYGAGASEAALTKGEDVYIVGGGNSAGQAAMHFAGFAKRIFIVIRGESLKETLSQYLLDRLRSTPTSKCCRTPRSSPCAATRCWRRSRLRTGPLGSSAARRPAGSSFASAACRRPTGRTKPAWRAMKEAICSPGLTCYEAFSGRPAGRSSAIRSTWRPASPVYSPPATCATAR